jgi:hypothetical protein
LDRLDVAFSEEPALEQEALRALFRCYQDISPYRNIELKIFLRSDIWSRITEKGMREASHIEKSLVIEWNPDLLMNLVIRRVLVNDVLSAYMQVKRGDILSDFEKQRDLFYRMFPKKMMVKTAAASNRAPMRSTRAPATFEWVLDRITDSTRRTAPREMIHFLNELRRSQITKFQMGEKLSSGDGAIFSQAAVRDAIAPVSKARLEQTLYAEYPGFKPLIERLRQRQSRYRLTDLKLLWRKTDDEVLEIAERLKEIGFLDFAGHREWRIARLYRPALDLVDPG